MKTNLRLLVLLGFFVTLPCINSFSQVSISSDNSSADESAMLDVKSTTKGVLIPRMTHTQLAAISDPADGLMVFCTDCGTDGSGSLSIFIAGEWNTLNANCLKPLSPGTGTHTPSQTQIVWNWNAVSYATGYKWNTINDYASATDKATVTTTTETGLVSNTAYTRYVWAYNSCGESTSTTLTQTTSPPVIPTVTTTTVSNITQTTASGGGNVTSDGGGEVTERGVCWSTSVNPEITGSHTTDGSGTGTFAGSLTGLTEGTLYYVRAYATNSAGTAYGNEISFSTSISDIVGNIYKTVIIGSQMWMAENLKTTKYNNGSDVPNVTINSSWSALSTGAYCWYQNNYATYGSVYGAMYNFYAINTGNLCPTGWHVPTDAEWCTLEQYVDPTITCNSTGDRGLDGGGKLKETGTTHWASPNTGATNSSGFTARPGGFRWADGVFYDIPWIGVFWTSTEYNSTNAWRRWVHSGLAGVTRDFNDSPKRNGNSVRCVKD